MLSGIGQGNNLAFLSSSAARPAMVGGFTMDVTRNDTPWERATAVMTHVLRRITTLDVRLLGCIFWIPQREVIQCDELVLLRRQGISLRSDCVERSSRCRNAGAILSI